MATITDYLNKILSAVYGKDVRKAIYDAIHQCYEDGRVGAVDLIARERINNFTKLPEGSTTGDAELIDIRVGANGVTYETAGEAVRKQIDYINQNFATLETSKLICNILEYCAFADPSVSTNINMLKEKLNMDPSNPDSQVNLAPYCVFESPAPGIQESDSRIGVKVNYSFEVGDTIKLTSPIGNNYRLAVGNNTYKGPWILGGYLDISNEYTFSDSDISGGYGNVLLIKRTDEAVIQQDDIDNIKICLVVIKHG